MSNYHFAWKAPRTASLSRPRVKAALLALVVCAALFLLPGCGLIGGGVSQEEYDALATQLETAQLEADSAFADLKNVRAQLAQAQAQAKARAQTATAASGAISLERARLKVIRHAQENLGVYTPDYQNVPLVWEVYSAEEKEEFYYIYLTYQPFGAFPGTPGREEFIVDKTGEIEFRQVLEEPNPEAPPQEASPPPSPRVRFTTSPR